MTEGRRAQLDESGYVCCTKKKGRRLESQTMQGRKRNSSPHLHQNLLERSNSALKDTNRQWALLCAVQPTRG